MSVIAWVLLYLLVSVCLAYHRASLRIWTVVLTVVLIIMASVCDLHPVVLGLLIAIYALIFIPLNVRFLRRLIVTRHIFTLYQRAMPSLSATEKAALEAGSVGWEGALFTGMPDWEALKALPMTKLSEAEQAFLDGPTERLCRMIDNWNISRTMEIPEDIWDVLKKETFFGMIIPKEYGGLEFSALAHAQVLLKIASASVAVATVVAVPNSLGPGELIVEYGTKEQKQYYLSRLATGEDIPCFGLTSPVAGSDAGSLTDSGVVCRALFEGEEQLCLRLNWDKRYITLAPVATLLGLAFKCYDPEHLLSEEEERGITCALVPTQLSGVTIGRRHYPLDCAFPNGPTQGKDVLIPIRWVIGGEKMIGQGWRMLMENLAAGRSISLPSMVAANAKRVTLASGVYAAVRRQFNTPLASFEGIQEVLARMLGQAYATEALRCFTLSYLDRGETPAVASAISKCHTTEMSRRVIVDAMDVHGGKGICMGPKNYLAQTFIESPIAITVEGANILTRSMIVFGQGAIRCHPYILNEIRAAEDTDKKRALIMFDSAVFQHFGFVTSNFVRSFVLGVTGGRFMKVPDGPLAPYYRLLSRLSSVFAFVTDMTMMLEGAQLKRRESLSARLGDILSYLYIGSSVLKHYEQGNVQEELPIVQWVCRDILYRTQMQLDALIANLPRRGIRALMRAVVFPRGKHLQPPSDALSREVAALITVPGPVRDRLSEGLFQDGLGTVLEQVLAIEPLQKKLTTALRTNKVSGYTLKERVASAVKENVFTEEEAQQFLTVDAMRMELIHVDDFAADEFV